MKMIKKFAAAMLSCVLITGLSACGNNAEPAEKNDSDIKTSQTKAEVTEQVQNTSENDNTSEDGKVLVAFYSASGNTERAAGLIAEAAGAELFEILPVEEYSSADLNWTDNNSRVSVEHDDPDKRDVPLVSTTPDEWDSYDVVFIGYPIWWGIAAWPVDNFITQNDFTGKTVIPFCTSTSSGLGQSGELLRDMAGTGNWLEGQRFRENPSEEDITEWVENLGL